MKVFFFIACFLSFCLFGQQKELTIQECIDLASKNPKLTISQHTNIDRSMVNLQFGKLAFLPTIGANTSYNISFGRKLDPFTNSFGVNSVYSNSYGLTSQAILFQGLRYFKQNKVAEQNTIISKLELERAIEKTRNQVLDKCFEIWKIQLKMDQQTKSIHDQNVFKEHQTVLVKEGRLSPLDTLETSITVKNKKIELINLEQKLSFETIQLNYYLGLPLLDSIRLAPYKPILSIFELTLDEYYQLEDLKNKLSILELEYKVAKTEFIPTITFYGNVGTGYSTNNKDYSVSNTPIIPFSEQIPNNAYQGIGFSLNIPIFNKFEWFKKQRLYEINRIEQNELIELKEYEIEKKKAEIEMQKQSLEKTLILQKSILFDKETIFTSTQMLYISGKIRLNELEKLESEYYQFKQQILDLEIELLKMKMIKIK